MGKWPYLSIFILYCVVFYDPFWLMFHVWLKTLCCLLFEVVSYEHQLQFFLPLTQGINVFVLLISYQLLNAADTVEEKMRDFVGRQIETIKDECVRAEGGLCVRIGLKKNTRKNVWEKLSLIKKKIPPFCPVLSPPVLTVLVYTTPVFTCIIKWCQEALGCFSRAWA